LPSSAALPKVSEPGCNDTCSGQAGCLALLFTAGAVAAQKPTNDDCLACHGTPGLTQEVDGQPVDLHVDPDKFKNSMHGGMFTCVDCHSDVRL
jgi:hypothetical protein